MNDLLELKKEYAIAGRAATGIYALLKARFSGRKVLLPCNICYAAVYPVIFSGNHPVFCDVDALSGNATLQTVTDALSDDVAMLILPHMFGNPVRDIAAIAALCKKHGILLLEDCASSMGARMDGAPTGTFGDYALYSLGYSKTLDVGYGGILCADEDLRDVRREIEALPLRGPECERLGARFSKMYRAYRNRVSEAQCLDFLEYCRSDLRDMFLFRLCSQERQQVTDALCGLEDMIALRREKCALYAALLHPNAAISGYEFTPGAVPWRFNFFVRPDIRNEMVRRLLEKSVPVSDWYPVVADLFGGETSYPGANALERQILNLPLLLPDDSISQIADTVNHAAEVLQ
ncbi:MAG: DegT/DnrJ/EryC1/StrS family aminotransferase [Eubacteriales bacterium]|nr:DegT/DnrJ/EryC1/StrS family aminotransferase [Eubacteriales bacterium]